MRRFWSNALWAMAFTITILLFILGPPVDTIGAEGLFRSASDMADKKK
jgi:hypothetical protein